MRTEWLGQLQAAAEGFQKAYPKDPRRFVAQLLGIQAEMNLAGAADDPAAKDRTEKIRQKLSSIEAAADASKEAKTEAAFLQVSMLASGIDPGAPEAASAFFKASAAFLEKYGESPLAPDLRRMELQIASQTETPEAGAI